MVLFVHPKDWSVQDIEAGVLATALHLEIPVEEVVSGRADFHRWQPFLGSWRAWCHDVVHRRDQYGKHVYDVLAFPEHEMGRAAFEIHEEAVRCGRVTTDVSVVRVDDLDEKGEPPVRW